MSQQLYEVVPQAGHNPPSDTPRIVKDTQQIPRKYNYSTATLQIWSDSDKSVFSIWL